MSSPPLPLLRIEARHLFLQAQIHLKEAQQRRRLLDYEQKTDREDFSDPWAFDALIRQQNFAYQEAVHKYADLFERLFHMSMEYCKEHPDLEVPEGQIFWPILTTEMMDFICEGLAMRFEAMPELPELPAELQSETNNSISHDSITSRPAALEKPRARHTPPGHRRWKM